VLCRLSYNPHIDFGFGIAELLIQSAIGNPKSQIELAETAGLEPARACGSTV
jgi:hypothetical protein